MYAEVCRVFLAEICASTRTDDWLPRHCLVPSDRRRDGQADSSLVSWSVEAVSESVETIMENAVLEGPSHFTHNLRGQGQTLVIVASVEELQVFTGRADRLPETTHPPTTHN